MAETIKQIGKERLWVGFPSSKVTVQGVTFLQDPYVVSDGPQQIDEIMDEDATLGVVLISDDRLILNFSGYLTEEGGAQVPKRGDAVTVAGFDYGIISEISISYTSKAATVSGTITAWGRSTTTAG